MCGIVGAIAERRVAKILIHGLERLEYRGYDSAGLAIINPEKTQLDVIKEKGKVAELKNVLSQNPLSGHIGIAHTRWATHGKPEKRNAHPHVSHNEIAVVHNGIIENYQPLKESLEKAGYTFASDTDTEVIAHLIHQELKNSDTLLEATQKAIAQLKGAYALGVISLTEPDHIIAARFGSPLVIGVGIEEHFIGSDPMALSSVTDQFIFLEEGDVAKISTTQLELFDENNQVVTRPVKELSNIEQAGSKGNFRHFMQKEIFEQPVAISRTLDNALAADCQSLCELFGPTAKTKLASTKRIHIIACGTSYHAGLVAAAWIEEHAGIPCQVFVASEHRYRPRTIVEENTLLIMLSQSGETADTLAALKRAKKDGYENTLAICNVAQSTLAREADLVFITQAGPEIGVAATKTFTAQLVALLLLTLAFAELQNNSDLVQSTTEQLKQLPQLVEKITGLEKTLIDIAHSFIDKQHSLFLGRGIHYPIALEGSLKLKEISYIHAEAYPAGELKHGPLALVDEHMPVIVLAPKNAVFDKLISNIEEVSARGGQLIVFTEEGAYKTENPHITIIELPKMPEIISPIVYNIPLQLLSYHIAVLKGTDIDQPRNLAKSVTVE